LALHRSRSELEPPGRKRSPVGLDALDAEEPVGRAPEAVAGDVLGHGVAVVLEPSDQDLLEVGHHLGPLDLVEAVLAELHHQPHVGRVDVLTVELAMRHLDGHLGGALLQAQLLGLADEKAREGLAEVDGHLLRGGVARVATGSGPRVQTRDGGDLDERHVPLLSRCVGELPHQVPQLQLRET
jgi:hypothetical protein